MFQRHDLDAGARGLVERGNDLGDALQIGRIVGDDQRIAADVGVDGVVGADQRPQHRHQIVGILVAQREDPRDDLVAADALAGDRVVDRDGAGLQLGVGLGHELEQPVAVHHRETQSAQRRQVAAVGVAHALRLLAVHGDGAAHPRVDQDRAVDHGREGTRHGLDVGVDEIHGHRRL